MAASDLARKFDISNEAMCQEVEILCEAGYGSMNANTELMELSLDTESPQAGFTSTPIKTHIFFPSKKVLSDAFYSSDLPKKRLPEYVVRLHLGVHQYGLTFFNEEVLSRYFDHPELYEIKDSLAGGSISALSSASEDRYLYVRYGKCRLQSGVISVSAINKDLAQMGPSEQCYWNAHEINEPSPDKTDENFKAFLSRTYEGAWVEYSDPIRGLLDEVASLNSLLEPNSIFSRSENVHLRMPVEQTYKSYCDCASELYKVVGPDALSQKSLKTLLQERFDRSHDDFIHRASGRPLSSLQLLEMLESALGVPDVIRGPLKKVAALRIDADHKVISPAAVARSYSHDFASICSELKEAIASMRKKLAN